MNKSLQILSGFLVLALLGFAGYTLYQQRSENEVLAGPIKIGWVGPLSGGAASYGESIRRGVEMASRELNPGTIEIVFEDTKCEGRDTVNAVNKLISVDGVSAIVGEVCSGATLAAAPVANQNGVVMISPASTSPRLSEAGTFFFRTVPSDASQGLFGANLVYDNGFRKLAVLYSNEEYGLGFKDVLTKQFSERGGAVVATETFGRDDVDVRVQIEAVKSAEPDAVYIVVNNPETAVATLKQLRELGVTVPLYGSEGLKSDDILIGAGIAAEGLIVTSVSAGTSGFIERHKAEYNGAEPGPFAAQGYDAMRALNLAILKGARSGDAIAKVLREVTFEGASGHIDFDEHGDVVGNYDVVRAKGGKFIPVE
ncbi:MAG: penicillin-binding protein activator [Patescibacteria group bacterium]